MRILNKRAKFNYHLLDRFEAGIALTGAEVRAVKAGRVDLSSSFCKFIDGELFLLNANISLPQGGEEATRARKLLLHKKELLAIQIKAKQKRLTIVPVKMYTTRNLIKVEIALAKTKRKYEKKEKLKKKEIRRDIERRLKI